MIWWSRRKWWGIIIKYWHSLVYASSLSGKWNVFDLRINFFCGEFQFKEQITRLPTISRLDILNLALTMATVSLKRNGLKILLRSIKQVRRRTGIRHFLEKDYKKAKISINRPADWYGRTIHDLRFKWPRIWYILYYIFNISGTALSLIVSHT